MENRSVKLAVMGIIAVLLFMCACFAFPLVGVVAVAIQRGLLEVIPWERIGVWNWLLLILFAGIVICSFLFFLMVVYTVLMRNDQRGWVKTIRGMIAEGAAKGNFGFLRDKTKS